MTRATRRSLVVGAVGGAIWGVALLLDATAALHAYLTAWLVGLSVALGALCLVMIAHVTGARWFVVVRRLAEATAATLPVLALLFLPLVAGMEVLYPWARPPGALPEALREAVAEKEAYLNRGFFLGRAALYFAVWIGLAEGLRRLSLHDDRAPGAGREARSSRRRRVTVSAVGLPAFGFTVTFAAFDWILSLDPEWHSGVFGLYYFAGAVLAALAVLVLLAAGLQRRGALPDGPAASHYHALGRLLLTFVLFWAYIAYSQGFVAWIADLPEDASWYLARWEDGWSGVLVVLGIGHFALPFVALLSRDLKRRPVRLSAVAAWLLAMHVLDVHWLVGPSGGAGPWPGWEEAAALLAVAGLATAAGLARMRGRPAVPVGDPELEASLRYESR